MTILKHMMLQHPAPLVLLVQEVQRLSIEREVRVVDGHGRLPVTGVWIPARVGLWTRRRDEDDAMLFIGGGRHVSLI